MCRLMSTTAAVQWFLEWQNPVILIIVLLHALTLRNFRVILKSAAMAVAQDCYLTATCSCSFSSCTTRYYVSDLPLEMIIRTSGLSLGKVLAVLMQWCASSIIAISDDYDTRGIICIGRSRLCGCDFAFILQCNVTPTQALDSAPSAIILLTYFQRSDAKQFSVPGQYCNHARHSDYINLWMASLIAIIFPAWSVSSYCNVAPYASTRECIHISIDTQNLGLQRLKWSFMRQVSRLDQSNRVEHLNMISFPLLYASLAVIPIYVTNTLQLTHV